MISLPLTELASILGVDAAGLPAGDLSGVTIDSRQDCEDRLFVAIRGDNFDGHDFVDAARQGGAAAALVERRLPFAIPQIVVDDCRVAMAQLANYWRRYCDPCVIALTGSNGKTTVKEMLFRILSQQASSLATTGNFNNDIGVPLTLYRLDRDHQFAIVEMGANHRGEIAVLAEIAEPDIVYVNNAAAAHLEGFGDLQGVIEGKGELYAYCTPEQQALFNTDEAASGYWRSLCAAENQMSCALDRDADVGASWSQRDDGLEVEFEYDGEKHACSLGVFGEHNVRNALAAVSRALLAGVDLADAVASLDGFGGVKGRLQMLPGPAQSRLVDDSYNANPDSLEAGLRVVCSLPGCAWLALGDMAELGDDARERHCQAALLALELGVEKMFALGQMSCDASTEFGDAGFCFDDVEEMSGHLLEHLHRDVNLLIKGSRAAAMDRLVALLTQPVNGGDANAV